MAAQNNRTVTLTLATETTGAEGVKDLATELRKLGKEGGDAAPEFERLSKELDSIAQQQDAVNAMKALTDEVQKSVGVLNSAKEAVAKEDAALDSLTGSLRNAKASEEAHAVSVRAAVAARQQANQQYLEARAAISTYVAQIGGAKRANDEQKVTLRELNQAVRESKAAFDNSKAAVAALTPEYDKLKSASAGIAAEVKQQEHALRAAAKVADSAKEDYDDLSTALGTTSQQADRLGVNTTDLAAEQNRLKQSTIQLAQEADKLKVSLKATGDVALTSAQRIAQAFSGTSVKSANALQNEILKINQGLMRLAKDTTLTEYEFNSAFSAGKARIAELDAEMKKATATTKSFASSVGDAFKQFGPASAVFNIISAGMQAITSAAARIPEVAADFQTLERSLRILTGSTASARKEMAYIADVANRVGADIKGTADGYVKLTAATKGTNLEGKQTKEVFESIVGAMGALGASSADTENALMAVTQMVTKGVVSMEEMRQQLGERLPQSFQATAKALGITTSELNDLISTGKLTAEDVLPALATGLKEIYDTSSKNNTLRGQWAEFGNGLKQFADAFAQTGILDLLLSIGRIGTAAIVGVVDAFILGGQTIAAVMRGLKINGNFAKEMDQLADKARAFNDRFAAISGTGPEVSKTLETMAADAQKAGREFIYLDGGIKIATASIVGASNEFIKFSVDSAKAQKSAEGFSTSARKSAEYTRASGEASLAAANALGNEIEKRQVAVTVADANTAALGRLAGEERKVLGILEQRAERMAIDIRDGKLKSEAHVKQINELGEEIGKQRAVVEGIEKQTEANRLLAISMQLQEQMLQDNSDRMGEYAEQKNNIALAIEFFSQAVKEGIADQAQLTALEEENRKVTVLQADAIQDKIDKIEAEKNATLGLISIDQANVRLAIEVQKGIQANARARGDEAGAVRAGVEIKRLEIQMAQLVAKAKMAEAESSQLLALAKIEELRTSGPMTAAKEAEIRALEAAVKVKQIEAQIAGVTAKSLEELKFATLAAGDAAHVSSGGYNNMADAMNNAAAAAGRLNAAQGGGVTKGADGTYRNEAGQHTTDKGEVLTDKNGNPITNSTSILDQGHQTDKSVDVESMLYKRNPQATVDEVKAAVKYYGELYQREAAKTLTGNLGNAGNAARLTNQVSNTAMDKALELARKEVATGQAIDIGTSVDDLAKRNLARNQPRGFGELASAYKSAGNEANQQTQKALTTVNFTFDGRKSQLTTDAQGAKTLANLFSQLEIDAQRTF